MAWSSAILIAFTEPNILTLIVTIVTQSLLWRHNEAKAKMDMQKHKEYKDI